VGGTFEITGSTVRFNGGDKPIATVGSAVSVTLPPNLLMAIPAPPGFGPISAIPMMLTATGVVTSGDSTLLGNGP
jgi:hypothetical protein